jgi:hypothetical protein
MRNRCLLAALVLVAAAQPALGGADRTPAAFSFPAADDTVRSNLWLARALMAEIVADVAADMPPPPASVLLRAEGTNEGLDVFTARAAEVLERAGYALYLPVTPPAEGDSAATEAPPPARTDYELRYRIEDLRLAYPESGRRFGVWRSWVARDMVLSAYVTVLEPASGRLLLSDRLERSYRDRVPSARFAGVRSDLYPFTDAQLQDSGWRRRLEEMVVLGTLTGLVAIYFANTGD